MVEKESAPQDLMQKLEAIKGSAGKARCKLHHLEKRIGFKVLESDTRGPTRVEVYPMDVRTTWVRVRVGEEWWFEPEL